MIVGYYDRKYLYCRENIMHRTKIQSQGHPLSIAGPLTTLDFQVAARLRCRQRE